MVITEAKVKMDVKVDAEDKNVFKGENPSIH
jgi:hypothetical protein